MMINFNEPSYELALQYVHELLGPTEAAAFEAQCNRNEQLQDQVNYLRYLLEELKIPPDTPLEVTRLILNYEMAIREEKAQLALNEFIESEQESYELEIEIDQLLHTIERMAQSEKTTISEEPPQEVQPPPQKGTPYSPLSMHQLFQAFNLLPGSLQFIGRKLVQIGDLLEVKLTRRNSSRTTIPPATAFRPKIGLVKIGQTKKTLFNRS